MTETLTVPPGWKLVAHPPSLFRRYEFGSYPETREFLDALALLSEETSLFPDLGFGKTYVNATLRAADGGVPTDADLDYAARAEMLAKALVL